MFKNYLKVAFRNLIRFKVYSLINVFGLAIGIAACILILFFVRDELSYDKFNDKAEQIYRVHSRGKLLGNDLNMAVSPAPLGETLGRDFPEVIQSTRLVYNANMLIRYKDNVFNETKFFWADSTIFDVFTIPFIKGNPKTALDEPHTIVLTETVAKKYFGNEDPIDKIMNMEDGTPYTVRGIVKDCPTNSHFHYDMFASLSSWGGVKETHIGSAIIFIHISYLEKEPLLPIYKKLPEFAKKYAGPQLHQILGIQTTKRKSAGMLMNS